MNKKGILAAVIAAIIMSAGVITAVAANSAQAKTRAMPEGAKAGMHGSAKDSYAKMAEDGVISQETYAAIKAYLSENQPQKGAFPKESEKREHIRPEAKMLEAGVITQAEYDAIAAAMPTRPEKPEGFERPEKPENFTSRPERGGLAQQDFYGKLAADGVISEKTAEAIKAYLNENQPQKDVPANESEKREHIRPEAKMLEAGVITQAEYDAITAAMPQGRTRPAPGAKPFGTAKQ